MTGTKKGAGADFVAVVRITDRHGAVLAAPGNSCDRVPEASLGWLERDGLIRHLDPPPAPAHRPRRKARGEEEE